MTIKIYTDGACLNNQEKENKGGWAYVACVDYSSTIKSECSESGGLINTTNQRMELLACIKAIEKIMETEEDVELYTDSAYVCNCINQKWYFKWHKNGWVNSKKEPVKNQDLWKRLLNLMGKKYVKFYHVKGHSGNKYNEKVDELARNAAKAACEIDNKEVYN